MRPIPIFTVFFAVVVVNSYRIHDIGNDITSSRDPDSLPQLVKAELSDLSKDFREQSSEYWKSVAQRELFKRINHRFNFNQAKNIIFFLGDGLSIPTLAAARAYKGQLEGKTGEEQSLFFENFPYVGLAKTYCTNRQVPDSSCTATAYLSGVKANFFTLGVSPQVSMNDCEQSENPVYQLDSIAKWAQDAGKAAGIVTTTTVTNASPAGTYAHAANRVIESDADALIFNATGCMDIAKQLITKTPGRYFNVIMGGGRMKFKPVHWDPEGQRLDGLDLVKLWLLNNPKGRYITTKKELLQLNYARVGKVLGLFTPSHMNFSRFANEQQPSLKEMTESAIRLLSRERRGYFLFVEGGRIDHGHHLTKPRLALEETLELAKAVERAREMTSESDTLIVVTSDHSHTMTISGYPARGNDILGLSNLPSDTDNLPYATLSYANGRQRYLDQHGHRLNLTGLLTPLADYPAHVPSSIESHGGDDVAVFASGPFAHLFSGLYEQHLIPHLMAYAACIGNGKTACL